MVGVLVLTMLLAPLAAIALIVASRNARIAEMLNLAASGKLQHASKLAEFHGTDAQPAKMWQGASQVEAANLFLDGEKHTMAARPQANGAVIHAVFAGANAAPNSAAPKSNKPAGNSVVRVSAEKMDYADLQREATFVGKVRMDGLTGGEGADVLDEELALERIGVVKVLFVPGVERELREVAVVEIEWKERGIELRGELTGQGGFAGAGTTGDADDQRALGESELFGRGHVG